MRPLLEKKGWNKDDITQNGNSFLIGNGRIGYRGTLAEFGKDETVALNLAGVYDQHGNEWRETVNMPNPFHIRVYEDGKIVSCLTKEPLNHVMRLLPNGIFHRETEFDDFFIIEERVAGRENPNTLLERYSIKAKTNVSLTCVFGMDRDIWDIHGPHFAKKQFVISNDEMSFSGATNEGKNLEEHAIYSLSLPFAVIDENHYFSHLDLKENDIFELKVQTFIGPKPKEFSFKDEWDKSLDITYADLQRITPVIDGDDKLAEGINYSVYQTYILGDKGSTNSIAARGVSGQTYKGAIFWDTEIFLLPFFALNEPEIAKNLIRYRIKTLKGGKEKAKSNGYKGAFFAWESQEDGLERCSDHNVTDALTGKPIRTYFGEKQIHISADIPYAIDNYIKITGDKSILDEGADQVIKECLIFLMDYASLGEDGLYHLNDVIGPDEYHERVDDNAFTSYMAHEALNIGLKYIKDDSIIRTIQEHLDKWYLPKPNEDGIIEQFKGYFALEDASIDEVKSRLRNPNEYWGGANGVATPTQIIKQADVVALMVLLGDRFDKKTKEANYNYYKPRTEHGSSLSDSMYSILAAHLDHYDEALQHLMKTAFIDIDGAKKQFAGGIYIGGTHPAANAGTYLAVVFGLMGLDINDLSFNPHLPPNINSISITYKQSDKIVTKEVHHD